MADEEHPGVSSDDPTGVPDDGVVFHYIKSPHFRTVHVDGAIGAVTARGFIHCAVYCERPAIPQVTFHKMNDAGQLEPKSEIVKGRVGYVRELETDLFLSYDAALQLREWLTRRLDELEGRMHDAEAKQS